MSIYQSKDHAAFNDPDSLQSRVDRAANDLDDLAEFDEMASATDDDDETPDES